MMRSALAAFVATLAAATTPAVLLCVHSAIRIPRAHGPLFEGFGVFFVVTAWHALILGLPAALVLEHWRRFRLLPMMVAGGVVGYLPIGLWLLAYASRGERGYLAVAAALFGLGASGGLAFFVVHRLIVPGRARAARATPMA